MAFSVEIMIEEGMEVNCTPARAFEILSDVPWSVSHFPNLAGLYDMGGGTYRWEMKKIGIKSYNIQTVYASKYTSNEGKGTVKWTAVKGVGNGQVSGSWLLTELEDGTTWLDLKTKGVLELPLPRLAKMVIAPFVRNEFENYIGEYMNNLLKTMQGKKKRPKTIKILKED